MDRVCEIRGLKPSSIWKHLGHAATLGKIDARSVVDLPDGEIDLIMSSIKSFEAKGIVSMTPVFETLNKQYSYEMLRFLKATG